jgi:hypothetical protein
MNQNEKTKYHNSLDSFFNREKPELIFQELLEMLVIHKPEDPLTFLIDNLSKKTQTIINIVIGSFNDVEILNLNYEMEREIFDIKINSSDYLDKKSKKIFSINVDNYGNPRTDLEKELFKLNNIQNDLEDIKIIFLFNFLKDIDDIHLIQKYKINYHQMFYFESKGNEVSQRNYLQLKKHFDNVINQTFEKKDANLLLKVVVIRPSLASISICRDRSSI